MKPRFKKGEKVIDDIYYNEWKVIDIVQRDDSFEYKYLYQIERTEKKLFRKKVLREWRTSYGLNKFIK